MKWPFVRRSFHDNLIYNLVKRQVEQDDIIANQMNNIESQFNEINRLNQELASELNSHRETKECFEDTINGLRIHNSNLEKELEETKDALKIAQEDLEKESKNYLKKYAIFKDTQRKIYHIIKESL